MIRTTGRILFRVADFTHSCELDGGSHLLRRTKSSGAVTHTPELAKGVGISYAYSTGPCVERPKGLRLQAVTLPAQSVGGRVNQDAPGWQPCSVLHGQRLGLLDVRHTRNNPVRYTDPSGHRYISPRPDPEEVPNPGPEILLPPSRSPTGDPVQVYWSEVESWDPGTTAEFVSVVASPFAAPVVGIAGDTMIGEVALPGLQTLWWKFASWAGLACADGDCGNEVRSVWQLRPWERGRVIEGTLGRSPELAENFPTIDRFENGVATSIKSIDLNAASYQNPARLSSTVMRYLNTLARWNGQQRPWGNIQISPADVQEKVLELAVPPGASPSQWRTLVQLQQTASEMNVRLDIVIFH